nr:hypothetical protein CFP56_72795 [Quercus suber]
MEPDGHDDDAVERFMKEQATSASVYESLNKMQSARSPMTWVRENRHAAEAVEFNLLARHFAKSNKASLAFYGWMGFKSPFVVHMCILSTIGRLFTVFASHEQSDQDYRNPALDVPASSITLSHLLKFYLPLV